MLTYRNSYRSLGDPFERRKKRSIKKIMIILIIGVITFQFIMSVIFYWFNFVFLNEMMVITHSRASVERLHEQKELFSNPLAYTQFGVFNVAILHYIDRCIHQIETTDPPKSFYIE